VFIRTLSQKEKVVAERVDARYADGRQADGVLRLELPKVEKGAATPHCRQDGMSPVQVGGKGSKHVVGMQ